MVVFLIDSKLCLFSKTIYEFTSHIMLDKPHHRSIDLMIY